MALSAGSELDKAFGLGWAVLAEIDDREAFTPVKAGGHWKAGLLIGLFVAILLILQQRQITSLSGKISDNLSRSA